MLLGIAAVNILAKFCACLVLTDGKDGVVEELRLSFAALFKLSLSVFFLTWQFSFELLGRYFV